MKNVVLIVGLILGSVAFAAENVIETGEEPGSRTVQGILVHALSDRWVKERDAGIPENQRSITATHVDNITTYTVEDHNIRVECKEISPGDAPIEGFVTTQEQSFDCTFTQK